MSSSRLDATRGAVRGGALDMLATAGGVVLLIVTLLLAFALLIDVVGRYGAGSPFFSPDAQASLLKWAALGFGAAALLGLPAALAAPFRRMGDPPLRSRSALALVPGCFVALIVLAITAAAFATEFNADAAALILQQRAVATLGEFVSPVLWITLVLGALFGGAHAPESTAAAAAPVVLVTACGVMTELSILGLLAAMLLPLLAAAIAIAPLYAAAPARALTPWLAGFALAVGLALLLSPGLVTPTEGLALIAVFAIPITLLVRMLALGQPVGPMLRQSAMEMAAVSLIIIAGTTAGQLLTLWRAPMAMEALGSSVAMLIAVALVSLVAGYLLTPLLALALVLPMVFPMLNEAAIDPSHAVAVLVLLGLAAVAARSARAGGTATQAGLPPMAAWIMAAAFVALAAAVALVPEIALAPMRALQ